MKKTFFLFLPSFVLLAACASCLGCDRETHEQKVEKEKTRVQQKGELASVAVQGLGEILSGNGSAAAETITKGVLDVASGMGRGMDKGAEVKITTNEKLAEKGIAATVATKGFTKHTTDANSSLYYPIDVYITSSKNINTTMQLRLYSANNAEIGRSDKITISMGEDDGKYLHFKAEGATPDHVTLFETPAPQAKP